MWSPLDETTNNGIFATGDILPGIQFTDGPVPNMAGSGDGIAVLGAGFAGNPSKNIVSNYFVQDFEIIFPDNNVYVVGMDLVSYFGADTMNIDVYGPGAILLDSTTALGTNAGSFWGISSTEYITRIVIDSPTDQAEGLDNIAFGMPRSLNIYWYDDYEEEDYAGSIREYLEGRGHTVTYQEDDVGIWPDAAALIPNYDVIVAEHTCGGETIINLDQWFAAGRGYVALFGGGMYNDPPQDDYIMNQLGVGLDGGYDDGAWTPGDLFWADPGHSIANYPNSGWDITDIPDGQYQYLVDISGGDNVIECPAGPVLQTQIGVEGAGKIAVMGSNYHDGDRTDPEARKLVENMIFWAAPPVNPYVFQVTPPIQLGLGWVGDYVDHTITIRNTGAQPDVYRLYSSRGMFIWPVEVWNVDNTLEISHSDIVQPGGTWDFNARVRIPRVGPGEFDIGTIGIESVGNPTLTKFVDVGTLTSLFPPFYDSFESETFGWGPYTPEDWTVNDPALAGVNGWTSQVGGFSMWINGGAEITSAPIYLSNVNNPIVSYWIQRGDVFFSEAPDVGDDLVVEYYNVYHRWVQLDSFSGDGMSGEEFNRLHVLPPSAICPDFKLRFRQLDGAPGSDYWHIDDVFVGTPESNFDFYPGMTGYSQMVGSGTQAIYDFFIDNYARHSDSYDISIRGNTWPTWADPTPLQVGPADTGFFNVYVNVPIDAIPGTSDTAIITVTSMSDPSVFDTVIVTTTVGRVHNLDQDTWFIDLQPAIDAANPGEHIYAYSGTYYENILINKPLTITGDNSLTTIIDGATVSASNPNVLIAFADDGNAEPLKSQLIAMGGLGTVDSMDVRFYTPTLGELLAYDVVITWTDNTYQDKNAMGDVLADYLDAGGKVIQGEFNWYDSNYILGGRFNTGLYSPFISDESGAHYSWANLGVHNAGHPIMAGIGSTQDFFRDYVSLSPGADLVASWDDGEEFVATKGQVVGINSYPGLYRQWTGDVDKIYHNAIFWLLGPEEVVVYITSNFVAFSGFTVENSETGILLDSVFGCEIYENTVQGCSRGILLQDSDGNIIHDNNILNNAGPGIHIVGSVFAPFQDDFTVDSGRWVYYGSASRVGGYCQLTPNLNTQTGRIMYDTPFTSGFVAEFDYLAGGGTGADGLTMFFYKEDWTPQGGGSLGFVDGDGTALGYGIEFDNWPGGTDPSGQHIAIIKDQVTNHLAYVNDARVEDTTWHHAKVIVTENSITVFVDDMINALLTWNGAVDNTYGRFGFTAATGGANNNHWVDNIDVKPLDNEIMNNRVENNDFGFVLEGTQNNLIYHNNIVGNTVQATDDGNMNAWDNGYPFGGNYWSDYVGPDAMNGPLQNIPGSDGMGDVPYVIDADSGDQYPLKKQHVLWSAIWSDDFEDGDISDWTISGIGDAGVTDMFLPGEGLNSGAWALYTRWDTVELLSPIIPLSGYSEVSVSYWIQKGDDSWAEDPDGASEDLFVEYFSNIGTWILLDDFDANALADGEEFWAWHNLPGNALHDNFQLRFRQEDGSGPDNDYWHIDDVAIYDGSVIESYNLPTTGISTADDLVGGSEIMGIGTPEPMGEIIPPVEEEKPITNTPATIEPAMENPGTEKIAEPVESPNVVEVIDDTVEESHADNLVIHEESQTTGFPVWTLFVTISMLAIAGYFYRRRK
ncbi:MAG: right-handed parallel beta-helix repeat-containing protein [Candidatus Thermoplasmatota archaeon]|nr:right-handed parallel beta-helix repeat-containing protein [Candidatus Thermoplasmatota archaeon]MBU4145066.1 right-handed parallel beta-helix repeat-containing protein [Candidatus Thermoplasmatota archaeon]MBU4592784.1 right-handed parallel beta-helix repeat-containing protein [Candidatus Thermoplasmatota archaeon]